MRFKNLMQKLYFGVKLYSKQIVNFAGTGHPKKVACRNEKILSDTANATILDKSQTGYL